MTFHYRGYGLGIDSDRAFPELTAEADGRPCDLRIRFDAAPVPSGELSWVIRLESSAGEPWLLCARLPGGYLVRFPRVADFFVRGDGSEICCAETTIDRDDCDLRHIVLDQVMPLALKLRGDEVLHATAVRTPHGVCAFIGPSGGGKSTLAAAFLRAGHQVICDDCLRLDARDSVNAVVPAYPGVRLCRDTLAAVQAPDDTLLTVGSTHRKIRWLPRGAQESFTYDRHPLARIYRLVPPGEATAGETRVPLRPLSIREAFAELAGATFRFDALDRAMLTREFLAWERLARGVPMRRLRLDDDLRSVKAHDLVLDDLAQASARSR